MITLHFPKKNLELSIKNFIYKIQRNIFDMDNNVARFFKGIVAVFALPSSPNRLTYVVTNENFCCLCRINKPSLFRTK